MNEQSMSPNSAGGGEAAAGPRPEHLAGVAPEQTGPSAPEMAPAPGSSPASAPAVQSQQSSKMTPDDVVKVIAAVPGPSGPIGAVPTPTMAGDVDVIEPEWVDKAEEVVRAHQGDPYGEEEAVEQLQEDYLHKRYGYTVADPNMDSNKPEKA